jgi:DNA replication licensing factor MCM6
LDECDERIDTRLSTHILKMHQKHAIENIEAVPFTKRQLQNYIRYAKAVTPVIPPESQRVLVECYRKLRCNDSTSFGKRAYRITVRQLESLIRLSEALARLHLQDEVKPKCVERSDTENEAGRPSAALARTRTLTSALLPPRPSPPPSADT